MESLIMEIDSSGAYFTLRSTYFDKLYLRMDASSFAEASSSGGGTVNCQYTANDWEKLQFVPQSDGTKAIQSVKFPGVFLRMDGTMPATSKGYGVVNC